MVVQQDLCVRSLDCCIDEVAGVGVLRGAGRHGKVSPTPISRSDSLCAVQDMMARWLLLPPEVS